MAQEASREKDGCRELGWSDEWYVTRGCALCVHLLLRGDMERP